MKTCFKQYNSIQLDVKLSLVQLCLYKQAFKKK